MTNWNLPNKIFSVLMALVFITTPLTGLDVVVAENDDVNKSASVTFTSPMKNDKMEAVISSTDTDDNHAILGNHEGRECLITQWQRNAKYRTNSNIATIPFKVEDSYIGENDRHIAINITFFDHEWDTFRIYYWTSKGEKTSAAVVKYGTNTWRTATVLLRDPSFSGKGPHGSDFYFTAFETDILRITEYISKIEVVNLDKTYLDEKAESKTDILHFTEAIALNNMGIFDAFKNDNNKYGLDKPLTLLDAVKSVVTFAYGGSEELASATCDAQDVPADTKPYVGLTLEKGIIQKRADGTTCFGK